MFKLNSKFAPTGDQPQAIAQILNNYKNGSRYQTLLGVTGSGKTFTMANVIASLEKPSLIMSHNKTLAAQLYQEFKEFFPQNSVHYFVSYYDYYQPEAYMPSTDTYIEKDASINAFIDQLRHGATSSLLTRKDTIVVASVSAIYGLSDPREYIKMAKEYSAGDTIKRNVLLRTLSDLQYHRNDIDRAYGTFSVKGDAVEIVSPDGEKITRFDFFGDTIEKIMLRENNITGTYKKGLKSVLIFPAKNFVSPHETLRRAITDIETELDERVRELKKENKNLEAERLTSRTRNDIAMMRETGYCAGIENYSRHISCRYPGERPFTLIDYFPDKFITFIDESHMTLPQIRGMYNGDRARKQTLIDFGFRLPSALDNRPLKFEEFEKIIGSTIYVSATPSKYELLRGNISEQLVRPTGLLDPKIEVRKTAGQVDDALGEIKKRSANKERSLLICLTKRNAEDISSYAEKKGIRVSYLHSDIKTLDRPEILRNLRKGSFDVLVGINLLREGLDLPEVSLICVLDADKEGFLRNSTTLIQTAGRASRHINGHVIFYGDTVTESMKTAINETKRRRKYQDSYNLKNNISPTPVNKDVRPSLFEGRPKKDKSISGELDKKISGIEDPKYIQELRKEIEREMLECASNLEFERAAELRDYLKNLIK